MMLVEGSHPSDVLKQDPHTPKGITARVRGQLSFNGFPRKKTIKLAMPTPALLLPALVRSIIPFPVIAPDEITHTPPNNKTSNLPGYIVIFVPRQSDSLFPTLLGSALSRLLLDIDTPNNLTHEKDTLGTPEADGPHSLVEHEHNTHLEVDRKNNPSKKSRPPGTRPTYASAYNNTHDEYTPSKQNRK